MQSVLLQLANASGRAAVWALILLAAVVAAFLLYIGIALYSVLRAPDREQREVRYQMFRDLLNLIQDLFRHLLGYRGPR
jgi:predicted small integral membrane protein